MNQHANLTHWAERIDMAAAFRWTVKLNLHEAVANHFSLAVNPEGTRFLINPNGRHFARITASSLVEIDANDPDTLNRPDAPDATAWGLHGSIHRALPHARCAMHVHSIHATVLASLADSILPPIDQNSAMFFNRQVVDGEYGGMAFAEEAAALATGEAAEETASRREAEDLLRWALDKLSATDRMVVTLTHLEERPVAEAAELLGMSVPNVKVRAFRARKKLREILGDVIGA